MMMVMCMHTHVPVWYVHASADIHVSQYMCAKKRQIFENWFSFSAVGSGNWTQIIKILWQEILLAESSPCQPKLLFFNYFYFHIILKFEDNT